MSPARRLARILSITAPLALIASLLAPAVSANAVVPYPNVTITSPGATSSSAGTTGFQFTGSVNPSGTDTIQSFGLIVDGTPYGGTLGCPSAGSKSCSAQLLWEATAPSGTTVAHSIQVRMDTTQGSHVLSSAVSVTATHAVATPVIYDPSPGDIVRAGDVWVDADASFAAPRYGDEALSMALLVDGTQVDWQSCDPSSADTGCAVGLDWDASSAALEDHTLQVRLTTSSGGIWSSAAEHVTLAAAPPGPVVTITSPVPNANVKGTVNVTATGSVDPTSGDAPEFMALSVDDGQYFDFTDCPATGSTCTLSFPWDATGLTGRHTLKVGFATDADGVVSAPVTVTVTSPAPTVSVALAGDPVTVVRGVTTVTLTGSIDPSQTDRARDLQLYVNGEPWGTAQPCTGGLVCTATVSWNTASLSGAGHISLSARFDTLRGTALSSVRYVDIGLDLSLPGNVRVGVLGTTVNGVDYAQVQVWDKTWHLLSGVPVTVRVKPAVGAGYTVTGTTGADGQAQIPLRGHIISLLTATVGPEYASASNARKFIVAAVASCRLPASITHGRTTSVACKGTRVAAGTKVTLYFKYPHAGVHVLGHATFDRKGHATIVFVSTVRNHKVQLWAQVSNSASYAGVYTPTKIVKMI